MCNYLVYNPNWRMPPKKVHHTWHDAHKEAQRLAKKEKCRIFILKIDSIISHVKDDETELEILPAHVNNLTKLNT